MHKTILILGTLFSSMAFADDIEVIANAKNINGHSHKNVSVETYHEVDIRNTSGLRKDYNYIRCTQIDKERSCLRKVITLKTGERFKDHDTNIKYVVDPKQGIYQITALTQVNDKKTESVAMLTIS
jgi:hypothetical protein